MKDRRCEEGSPASREARPRRWWAATGLFIAIASPWTAPALADPSPTLLSEAVFFEDIPRVFSVSRLPQAPGDSPGAVTVVDREMIRASGARELSDLFRLVPGFIVGYASAGRPVVAYHGLSGQYSQRMQVMLDGRSLYAPYLFGGIDWNMLPVNLDDIERVEVVRGSNSASYGANAFLGMVNITTRAAAQSRGQHVSSATGAPGVRDAALRIGHGTGSINWRLSAGTRSDDGLVGLFDARRTDYAGLLSEWQINATDALHISAGVTQHSAGLGRAGSPGDPQRNELTRSGYGMARWRRSLSQDQEFAFTASHTLDRGDDRFFVAITPADGLLVDYGRRAARDHLAYEHFLALGHAVRASWGVEWRRDGIIAPQLFNTSALQQTAASRAYLNAEWRPAPWLTLNAGGLVERESLSGTHFAPRLVTNLKLDDVHVLRIGYSEAFRTPSLFEQRSDWRFVYQGQTVDIRYLSRGGLRPERVRVAEVSWLGNLRSLSLSADARLFHERIGALIVQQRYALPPGQDLDVDSGAYDLRNAGSARLTGIEYQVRWRPTPRQTWILGQYVARRDANEAYLVESMPSSGAHLMGMLRITDSMAASILYTAAGPIRWIGEAAATPGQHRLDLRLEQTFRLGLARATVAVVGQNLQGPQQEFRVGQAMPRRAWLTLSIDY